MRTIKRTIARFLVAAMVVTMAVSSGMIAFALQTFQVVPELLHLTGSVPNEVYFGDIKEWNGNVFATQDFDVRSGWLAPYGTEEQAPVLFVANNDALTTWHAVYNVDCAVYDAVTDIIFGKNYMITVATKENGEDVIHFSSDGSTWSSIPFPAEYSYRHLLDGTNEADDYFMFAAEYSGNLGVLVTEDFENWNFIEDFPTLETDHTLDVWDLLQGENGDWYIYSHLEYASYNVGLDSYGITNFYKADSMPDSAASWEKIGTYNNLAQWIDSDVALAAGGNPVIVDANYRVGAGMEGFYTRLYKGAFWQFDNMQVYESTDWNAWTPISWKNQRSIIDPTTVSNVHVIDEKDEWRGTILSRDSVIQISKNYVDSSSPGTYFVPTIYWGDTLLQGEVNVDEKSAPTAKPIIDEQDPSITAGIKLQWDAVPSAAYYRIYRQENGGTAALIADKVAGTSYVDINLKPDTSYTYIIKPYFEGSGEGNAVDLSNETVKTGTSQIPMLPDANGLLGTPKSYILMQIDNSMMDVNGTIVEVDPGRGTAPTLRYSRTVLPIRAVTEAMSGTVGWNEAEQKVTLTANSSVVEMWLGRMDYTANGANLSMDIAPFAENSRTFLPLRFAAENLNCRVTWMNDTKEILIVFNGEAKTY